MESVVNYSTDLAVISTQLGQMYIILRLMLFVQLYKFVKSMLLPVVKIMQGRK